MDTKHTPATFRRGVPMEAHLKEHLQFISAVSGFTQCQSFLFFLNRFRAHHHLGPSARRACGESSRWQPGPRPTGPPRSLRRSRPRRLPPGPPVVRTLVSAPPWGCARLRPCPSFRVCARIGGIPVPVNLPLPTLLALPRSASPCQRDAVGRCGLDEAPARITGGGRGRSRRRDRR